MAITLETVPHLNFLKYSILGDESAASIRRKGRNVPTKLSSLEKASPHHWTP
jgi:hypothetical protein